MWCGACQQDVPGVASPTDGVIICCPRCNRQLASGTDRGTAQNEIASQQATDSTTVQTTDGSTRSDDWRIDEDLRDVQRILTTWKQRADSSTDSVPAPHRAVPVASARPLPSASSNRRDVKPNTDQVSDDTRKIGTFAWTAVSIGLMFFACGAVLLVWSYFAVRSDLWTLGIPLVVVGQVGLLIGFMLQLESVSRHHRETAETLDELDDQLDDLRQATSLLNSANSNSSRSFYAHMAEGASPQMLLTDLKGQLDMLSVKLANERSKR